MAHRVGINADGGNDPRMTDQAKRDERAWTPEQLRYKHSLWEFAACGRHGTRERGEDDRVWDSTCYACATIHQKIERAVRTERERCATWLLAKMKDEGYHIWGEKLAAAIREEPK